MNDSNFGEAVSRKKIETLEYAHLFPGSNLQQLSNREESPLDMQPKNYQTNFSGVDPIHMSFTDKQKEVRAISPKLKMNLLTMMAPETAQASMANKGMAS